MSNAKRTSPGFRARTTTTGPTGITITPPTSVGATPVKHFVGADHAPTEEEALEMGRALFDQIAKQQASDARATREG